LTTLPDFDLAVFDEIHNLNHDEGDAYERLIKWHKGNFLALSATIKNPNQLKGWLASLNRSRNVEVVSYQKRFINVQRHLWDPKSQKVVKLHPLSCFNEQDFQQPELPAIAFTPWDSISVWLQLKSIVPDAVYNELDPEVYFSDTSRIHLDDTKRYEESIKLNLKQLSCECRQSLLQQHEVDESELSDTFSLLPLFSQLHRKEMFPAICFNMSAINCRDIFRHLVQKLEQEEGDLFPFHYENAEHRNELYQEYQKRREHLYSECKEIEREHKLMQFDQKELDVYQKEITERYQSNIDALKKRAEGLSINPALLKKQLSNLRQEYDNEMDQTQITEVDVFEKHADYCFSLTPMKADRIRSIRREIIRKTGIRIDYESSLIQGLKRGIGLYTKSLPDVYLRIVQELAQNRELGVVISDPSLALGINMPFRTSVMMGWKDQQDFTPLLYHQMSGRAGRRGMDCEGHVVFANVKWKHIMKGSLESIRGKAYEAHGYHLLPLFKESFADRIKSVNTNHLFQYTDPSSTKLPESPYPSVDPMDWTSVSQKIAWKLRHYGKRITPYAQSFDQMEVHLKNEGEISCNKKNSQRLLIFTVLHLFGKIPFSGKIEEVEEYVESHLEGEFRELVEVLSTGHISQNTTSDFQFKMVNMIIEIGEIVKLVHNALCGKSFYQCTERVLATSFDHCRKIVFSYHSLNE
jgi:hypothetical protein